MSKPIILSKQGWNIVYEQLKLDYPRSVWMIRSRMKDKLGFTVREHIILPEKLVEVATRWDYNKCVSVRLDFYSEPKRTMFLLKYCEHLSIGKTAD